MRKATEQKELKKATIKDVATEAGVSIGTVSNVLNSARYIHPDTRDKVMAAVEKLQYVPNLNGRYLKAGITRMLGFFTNSIAGPYFCTLLDAMCRQCERLGYHLAIFVTKDSSVILGNIMGQGLDGALIYEDTVVKEREIAMFLQANIKVVFLDREVSGQGIASVLFDSYKAGYEATNYLIRLGHRRIVFIECVDTVIDSFRRKEGFLTAMKESGFGAHENLIIQGAFDEGYTFNAIKDYMRSNTREMPDAFLAGNDMSAIGCIKALQSEGYCVPDDISVMGFDDIDIAQYYRPALTTINNPISRQGLLAIDTLVNMIENRADGGLKRLEGNLIVRDSCTIRKC